MDTGYYNFTSHVIIVLPEGYNRHRSYCDFHSLLDYDDIMLVKAHAIAISIATIGMQRPREAILRLDFVFG